MELSEFLYGFHPIISFELYVRLTLDSSVGCNGAILFTFRKKTTATRFDSPPNGLDESAKRVPRRATESPYVLEIVCDILNRQPPGSE